MNRMLRKVALASAIATAFAHSQTCNETTLYEGSGNSGHMEESSRTFPEAPEWSANWGDFGSMKAPYIRLSGQKSQAGNWIGGLVFDKKHSLKGGNLSLDVRSTQSVKFGIWLSGNSGNGKVHVQDIPANTTQSITIPVKEIAASENLDLEKIWIELFDVNAYQYTTLFVDNIRVSCGSTGTGNGSGTQNAQKDTLDSYPFTDVDFSSPVRANIGNEEMASEAYAHYSEEKQVALQAKASTPFVLTEAEHDQIIRYLTNDSITPKESREGWYQALYIVNRNRTRDSVIANPKTLYTNAGSIAASYEMKRIPLLIADLDYNYEICLDSNCKETELKDYHLIASGLPTSYTRTSKVKLVYDPFFVTTTKKELPRIEICYAGKCNLLESSTEMDLEFNSAGVQQIKIKMDSGTTHTEQNLTLEVK